MSERKHIPCRWRKTVRFSAQDVPVTYCLRLAGDRPPDAPRCDFCMDRKTVHRIPNMRERRHTTQEEQ